MLISGGGGGNFTNALLQGRQLGIGESAQKNAAKARRQQLGLGIAGLGLGAVNTLGNLTGTIGNLVNQSARTGIQEQQLELAKSRLKPVPGSLFGHPELGDISPDLAGLIVDQQRAGRSDTEVKLNLNALTQNLGAIDEAERTGKMSPAQAADARLKAQKGSFTEQPALLRAIQNVKDLEDRPEHGAGAFEMDKIKGYSTDQMAETYAKILADPTIQPDLKREVVQEIQRRQQVLGKDVVPSFEEMQSYNPLTPGVSAPSGEPGADIFAERFQEAMNKARERKRRALEWAISQYQGIGPTIP